MTAPPTRHVAFAVVGSYLPHAASMVCSVLDRGQLLQSEGDALVFHLLHDGTLAEGDLDDLEQMVVRRGAALVRHVVPDERLVGLPTDGFTGKGSWYRIFLPELLPDVERVLYLDVDLLVLASLLPLFELEFGDALVAAVTNVFEPAHVHRPAALGLGGPEAYFNAGVLLLNLRGMRAHRTTAQLLEYGVGHAEELLWRDQDALNVVLADHRLELPPRWNCMNSVVDFPQSSAVFGRAAVEDARSNPAIRHYEGPSLCKPWHFLADPEMQDLYVGFRRRTPWPDVALEDETLGTKVIKRLPASLRIPAYRRFVRLRRRLRSSRITTA